MPLVGSASLEEIRQAMSSGVRNIDRLAREALASGNLDGAEKLLGEALRQDPNDVEALSLKSGAGKAQAGRRCGGCPRVAAVESAKPGAAKPEAVPPPPANAAGDLNLVGPPPAEEPPAAPWPRASNTSGG